MILSAPSYASTVEEENLLIPEVAPPAAAGHGPAAGPSLTDMLDAGQPPPPPPVKPTRSESAPSLTDLLDGGKKARAPASKKQSGNLEGVDPDTLQPTDSGTPEPTQAGPSPSGNTPTASPSNTNNPDNEAIPDSEIVPYDPELDEGSSPSPNAETQQPIDDDLEGRAQGDQEEMDGLIAHQAQVIEKQKNWLNLGLGLIHASTPLGLDMYFPAANIRYARILKNVLFIKTEKLQDAIDVEMGSSFFKTINFATQGDAYNVINLSATLRYHLIFSEAFRLFFHAGGTQGFLLSSNAPRQNAVNALTLLLPAIGGGVLLQIGPGWYVRLDLGYDAMGFGLTLKF